VAVAEFHYRDRRPTALSWKVLFSIIKDILPIKNALGELRINRCFFWLFTKCSIPACGERWGVVVVTISALLLFLSNSKTSIGLAFLSPLLAASLVLIGKKMRNFPGDSLYRP